MKKKYLLKDKKTINSFFDRKNKKIKKIYFKELIFLTQKNSLDHHRFAFFMAKKKLKKIWLKNKFTRIIKGEFFKFLKSQKDNQELKDYYDIVILKNRPIDFKEDIKLSKQTTINEVNNFIKTFLEKV